MELEAVLFFTTHYAFLTGVGILSYGVGRRLTQRMHFDGPAEQISVCTTLGLGSVAYLILLIGTLGILYHWLVLTVVGGITLLCLPAWREALQRIAWACKQESFVGRRRIFIVSLSIFLLVPIFLLPLYPPTAFDSTMYHLAYSKIYIQTHKMVFTPYLRFPVFPQTNEMLFTLGLLIQDGIAAQLIQFLMMMVLGIGLYAFGQRHFSQRTGIWAVAIFLSNPMILWLGATAYIDMGLALFVTMGTYSIINWIHSRGRIWILLGGVFLGYAAGSKYSALFFLILFGMFVLYTGIKDRKLCDPLLFVGTAVGIAFPWYFRNWCYTGNPVFPFFGQIFGYGLLNPQDLQGLLDDLVRAHGTGKSLGSLLLLPWNLAFNQPKFVMEAPFSKIYLFTLPFLFVGLSHRKIRGVFLVLFSYILFWFGTAQVLRYLVPIVPLLSLAVAASFERCLGLFPSGKAQWKRKGIATLAISIALFSPGWLYAFHKVKNDDYPPSTKYGQEVYLIRCLPSYPAYRYLNQTRCRYYSVYALFDENMAFFADGIFMGDWFGHGRFERIYSKLTNMDALYKELRTLGANYFLIRRNRVKMDLPQEEKFPKSLFKLIQVDDSVFLFEVL